MGFCLLASKPRPAPFLKGLEHGPKTYMFMREQVLLGGLIINTLCYMILHCQTRPAREAAWPGSSTMGFWLLASKPRPAPFLKGIEHGPETYMFMWEQVLLVGLINNTLCYMILHCQRRLARSIVRILNHGFLVVGF